MKTRAIFLGLLFGLMLLPGAALAAAAAPAAAASGASPLSIDFSGSGMFTDHMMQIIALITILSIAPSILIMMTSFVRIVVVLSLLRTAMGLQSSPPNSVIVSLALFLTLFVMSPVIDKVRTDAVTPYMAGSIDTGTALERGVGPLKTFMLEQTREGDIAAFVRMSGGKGFSSPQDVPLTILAPAFVTSELKTAFQIGFLLFIPFVIIDLVVASVLMSMGMMMLSPVLVSLPFKIMLFVVVDGWTLLLGTLAGSFHQ